MGKKTQTKIIEEYLLAGKSITPMEALERFGCFRLAAIIWKIRQKRHVYTTMITNKWGNSFAKYSLTVGSNVHEHSKTEQYKTY